MSRPQRQFTSSTHGNSRDRYDSRNSPSVRERYFCIRKIWRINAYRSTEYVKGMLGAYKFSLSIFINPPKPYTFLTRRRLTQSRLISIVSCVNFDLKCYNQPGIKCNLQRYLYMSGQHSTATLCICHCLPKKVASTRHYLVGFDCMLGLMDHEYIHALRKQCLSLTVIVPPKPYKKIYNTMGGSPALGDWTQNDA